MRPFPSKPAGARLLFGVLQLCLTVFLWIIPLHAAPPRAQTARAAPEVADSAMQAMYLFNFAKFIEWPEPVFADRQTPIRICLYGERPNDIRQAVTAIEGKTAHGREIRVKRTATLTELNDCQIVFIPANEKRWSAEVLRLAHAASALTVSDMDNFIDLGGGVGLVTVDNQLRFEFNLDATQAAQLKVSSQLLKLARIVKGQTVRY